MPEWSRLGTTFSSMTGFWHLKAPYPAVRTGKWRSFCRLRPPMAEPAMAYRVQLVTLRLGVATPETIPVAMNAIRTELVRARFSAFESPHQQTGPHRRRVEWPKLSNSMFRLGFGDYPDCYTQGSVAK